MTAAGRVRERQPARDQVAKTLGEIEAKAKGATKVTLDLKLARAGLDWTPKTYWTYSGVFGVIVGFMLFLLTDSPFAALGGVFFARSACRPSCCVTCACAGSRSSTRNCPTPSTWWCAASRPASQSAIASAWSPARRRTPARGVPHRVETQALGLSLGDAVSRLHERVPTAEVNFFSIVINIQQQSGGNLSEALNNLSRVLRDRAKMRGKIQAMSMEAKASASIIAALPFGVAGITTLTSPDYISLLWTTDARKIALVGSAIWDDHGHPGHQEDDRLRNLTGRHGRGDRGKAVRSALRGQRAGSHRRRGPRPSPWHSPSWSRTSSANGRSS